MHVDQNLEARPSRSFVTPVAFACVAALVLGLGTGCRSNNTSPSDRESGSAPPAQQEQAQRQAEAPGDQEQPADTPTQPSPGTDAAPTEQEMADNGIPPGDGPLYATFQTSQGTIVVRLFEEEAPKTVANFVGLATGNKEWKHPKTGETLNRPLYDGTSFHRVIPEFMIQGGDPLSNPQDGDLARAGTGGPGYRFEDEFQSGKRFDKPGILAMANSGPNTNGSQFFITEVPTPHLNNRHTIFGEVVEGFDNVPKIARVPAGPGNRPNTPVILEKVVISRGSY